MNYSSLIQIIEDGWLPFPDSVIPPFRKSVIWEKLPESIAKEQYEESKFDY